MSRPPNALVASTDSIPQNLLYSGTSPTERERREHFICDLVVSAQLPIRSDPVVELSKFATGVISDAASALAKLSQIQEKSNFQAPVLVGISSDEAPDSENRIPARKGCADSSRAVSHGRRFRCANGLYRRKEEDQRKHRKDAIKRSPVAV